MSSATPSPVDDLAPVFRGVGVALVTLFDRDGLLLVAETAALARQLHADGVTAVLIGGTTGEFWTLTVAERVALTQEVRSALPPEVPVLLNVGGPSVAGTLAAAEAMPDSGADAVLCLTPPAADPAELYPRVRERIGDVPLLAYHFPRAGFQPIPLDVLAATVDGAKDSSGDAERLVATPALPAGLYTGSPLLLGLAGALGIAGALLALANVDPGSAVAALGGDREAQGRLVGLHREALGDAPPRGVKRMVAERYGTPAFPRPLTLRAALAAPDDGRPGTG